MYRTKLRTRCFSVRVFYFYTTTSTQHHQQQQQTSGTRNALHGQVETRRDRWWDKLQLIVGDDATTMFQFEHSHSDGAAWNYWLEGVVRDAERGEIVAEVSASCAESPPLEELKWVCSFLSCNTHTHTHTHTHAGMS